MALGTARAKMSDRHMWPKKCVDICRKGLLAPTFKRGFRWNMVWLMSRGKRNLHHCIWIRLWVWDKNASDVEHLLSYGCSADARRKVLTLSDYGPHDWMGEHSEKACSFYSSEVTLSTIGKPVFTPKKNVKCKFKRSWEIIPLHLCLRLKLKLNQWFFFF